MARTTTSLPGGPRLSDHLSIGVLGHVFSRPAVRVSLAACGRTSQRRRALSTEMMVYFVLALGRFRSVLTREVLRCLAEGLRWLGAGPLRLAGRAALSHARKRLGVEPFLELRQRCVQARATAAFPQVRLTALIEVGTRVPLVWTQGPYRASERAQARTLQAHLGPGHQQLADRGYLWADLWQQAVAMDAHRLWRARRDTALPVHRVLHSRYGGQPVRVIEYAPAAEQAALYHERWEIETAYDERKTHMRGPQPRLRSKTPDLVRQEVEGLMLAYHAVRAFLAAAAHDAAKDLDDLSFVHAIRVVRRRLQNPGPRRRSRVARIRDLCPEILKERVVSSRSLHRPRGVKRKMSNYPIRRFGPLDPRRHAWVPLILAPAG